MIPYWTNGRVVLWQGHVLDALAAMEAGSCHMVATSPPYYGLRSYGLPSVEWPAVSYAPMPGVPPLDIPGCDPECVHVWGEERVAHQRGSVGTESTINGPQSGGRQQEASQGQYCQLCGGWKGSLGLEPTVEAFVGHIVLVARELRRVLRDDGTFWLNLGSSYQDKQELGIPWRVAFALQADNWILRSDIIWAKGVSFCPTYSGSCMPESVRDRPTKGHEYVFLLSKNKRYFYDAVAVRESCGVKPESRARYDYPKTPDLKLESNPDTNWKASDLINWPADGGRNLRTVWTINPGSYAGAHFATFPPALVEPMIKAGTSAKGCCPECGAPWVRVTERESITRPRPDGDTRERNRGGRTDGFTKMPNGVAGTEVTTTGWRPTCSCYDWEHCAVCGTEMDEYDKEYGDSLSCGHNICAECLIVGEAAEHVRECELAPVPCTVLDPFAGTFTTGEVADFLGRHSVGIELSEKYCLDHIIPRLTEPLFEWAEQEQQEPEPEIEQMGLL